MRVLGVFTLLLFINVNANAADISREYKIKAAYLYNLIKFVNWPLPEQAQEANSGIQPMNICVFSDSPFQQYLDVLAERKIKGRPIDIIYVKEQATLQACNILYLSKDNPNTLALLNQSKQYPLLTVGETAEFLNKGGIISLVIDDNNIQLQINLTQAKKVGFKISGNLLEIARKIQ